MTVKFANSLSAMIKDHVIDLGGGQSFTLHLRHPDFLQQVQAMAADDETGEFQVRLESMVAGWSGVEDDNTPPQPVPYSFEALKQLIAMYPQSFRQINLAIVNAYWVYPEDLRKNLPTPPANGGTTTTDATTLSTVS